MMAAMHILDTLAAFVMGLTGAAVAGWVARDIKLRSFAQQPWFSALACAAALLGLALGLYGTFGVPASQDLFDAFVITPPAPTQWLYDFPYALWAPLPVIALTWWLLRSHPARARYDLACFLIATLLLCLTLAVTIPPVDRLYDILRPW